MADFNLGRIRFVWQGLWEPSRDYVRDDVVQETDSSFVCIEAHTSGSTFAENSDKFEIMARGASATPTTNVGDIVYRGNVEDERLPIGSTGESLLVDSSGVPEWGFPEADLSVKSTDDLSEGSNLYYTDTRARDAVSAAGDLSYNSGTGTFSFAERTDSEVRNLFSAAGDLSYDSATGEFSIAQSVGYESTDFDDDFSSKTADDLSEGATNLYYTDTRVDSHLSGGTGVSYSSGSISIGQAVGTTDNVEFNDVAVNGSLTVSGGIDADTLDSQSPSFYLDYDNFTNTPPDPAALSFVNTLVFS